MDKPSPPRDPPHAAAPETTRPHASTSATAPLVALLRAPLSEPTLVEALAAITGAALTGVVVDWPRDVGHEALPRWLRPADALVELTRTPAREPLELGILLHAESATRVVERVLGGRASSAVASAVGALSDAECGVLAYAIARLCAAHPSGFVVRDVQTSPPPSVMPEPAILWPVSLRSTFAPIDGLLLLSPALAQSAAADHVVELLLRDALAPDAPLAPGDVLTSDRWTLTHTTEGLTGPVRIATPGVTTELTAQLARGAVRVTGPAPTAPPGEIALVIATRTLSLAAIAALASGTPCAFGEVGMQPAQLRRGDDVLAHGELVVHRGALGVHVTST